MFVGAHHSAIILSDAVTVWKVIWRSTGETKNKNETVVRPGLWRDLKIRQDGVMDSSTSVSVSLSLLLSITR